jgi:hypothetical protein
MSVVPSVLVLIILHENNSSVTWFQKYPRWSTPVIIIICINYYEHI